MTNWPQASIKMFFFDMVTNVVGKGENTGYQNFRGGKKKC